MGRMIGIDLGDRRVGISVSDDAGMFAHPLATIEFAGWDQLIEKVACLMEKHNADLAVVGVPRNMDGSFGDRSRAALRFSRKLASRTGKTVVTWDERLTTSQADKEMIALDKSRRKRRLKIDQAAAVLILEGYMQSLRTGEKVCSGEMKDDEPPETPLKG
ncbi:MAG TPA: Holliday junction resolvase RuvX [Firmicutes bacterium]|nr:Holliday junction resolvase RuvX [Candidatus Fermentithermobacillaceae bacterium]